MASHQSGCNALVFPGKVANQLFDYLGNRTCTLHTPSLSPVVLVGMTIIAIYVVKNPYTAYVMSNKHLFEKIVVTLQLSVAKLS